VHGTLEWKSTKKYLGDKELERQKTGLVNRLFLLKGGKSRRPFHRWEKFRAEHAQSRELNWDPIKSGREVGFTS